MATEKTTAVPEWARGIDHYGRKKWHKDHPVHQRKGEYIGNVIVGLISLWVVNKVPDWNLGFIRDNYEVILWMLNLSIMIQIGGNALMFLVEMAAVRYLARMVMETAGFVTNILLYFVYPFDFSHFHGLFWLDTLIPILLIVGMVVSALKVLTNFWKLVFWTS
jgi:hypothetical protein